MVERGISLFLQAPLPPRIWIYVFHAVAYTMTHLPTKYLNSKSPYELLYHKKPKYNFFSCL